jgi:hypothetical protein
MDPASIPAGGVGHIVVRLRRVPTTSPLPVNVNTSSNTLNTTITVAADAPQLANISFSEDLKKVYLYWRRAGGAAPTTIRMDGTDVTSITSTVGDTNDFAVSVISLSTPLASMSHLHAGKLKAYGITSSQRAPLLPNVPTLAEQGVQGYDFQFWNGVFAPAKTPDHAVRSVHKAVVHALQAPEVKERITKLGFMSVGSSPEEFAQFVKSEVVKFRKIILDSGISLL